MDTDKRKARVKRLKREILIFLCLMITIPWIFVIVLFVKNHSLKNEVSQNRALIDQYIETVETMSQKALEESVEEESSQAENKAPAGKVYTYEGLSPEEIAALKLSDEELYDGYRKVYLTFDDGPSSNTAAILDILKEYDVKATFFVICKEGRDNEALYRRIVDEGHTLGMHSCTHVYSTVYAGESEFLQDTDRLRDFLYMVTGVNSEFYRFPGGSSNKVSDIDMRVFGQLLKNKGIVYYDWNVSSQDASSSIILSKDRIVKNVMAGIEKHDESVILFHDTASKTTTVEALPEIIENIKAMDHAVILPITKETKPVQHISVE